MEQSVYASTYSKMSSNISLLNDSNREQVSKDISSNKMQYSFLLLTVFILTCDKELCNLAANFATERKTLLHKSFLFLVMTKRNCIFFYSKTCNFYLYDSHCILRVTEQPHNEMIHFHL